MYRDVEEGPRGGGGLFIVQYQYYTRFYDLFMFLVHCNSCLNT